MSSIGIARIPLRLSTFQELLRRQTRFSAVLDDLCEFRLANHRSTTNFCASQPALGQPGMNRPFAETAQPLRHFRYA